MNQQERNERRICALARDIIEASSDFETIIHAQSLRVKFYRMTYEVVKFDHHEVGFRTPGGGHCTGYKGAVVDWANHPDWTKEGDEMKWPDRDDS